MMMFGGRKKQWIAAMSGLLVFAFVFSLVFVGIVDFMTADEYRPPTPFSQDPEERLEYLQAQVGGYESYIEEFGPTVPVLDGLAAIYQELAYTVYFMDMNVDFDKDMEMDKDMDTDTDTNMDTETGEEPEIDEELPPIVYGREGFEKYLGLEEAVIKELLDKDEPVPARYIRLMEISLELERSPAETAELAARAGEVMSGLIAENPGDSWNHYYYSMILQMSDDAKGEKEQLMHITDIEEEGSELYDYAAGRLEQIEAEVIEEVEEADEIDETEDAEEATGTHEEDEAD